MSAQQQEGYPTFEAAEAAFAAAVKEFAITNTDDGVILNGSVLQARSFPGFDLPEQDGVIYRMGAYGTYSEDGSRVLPVFYLEEANKSGVERVAEGIDIGDTLKKHALNLEQKRSSEATQDAGFTM